MSRSNDIANITASVLDGVTAAEVGLGNVTNESKATMFTSPTFTGDVSATNIKHANSSSNNLVLGSNGIVTMASGNGYRLNSVQVFTTAGTHTDGYTKPPNVNAVLVYVTGGGGGGGVGTASYNKGGGGHAGGTAIKWITSGLGSTETVTVGGHGDGSNSGNGGIGGTSSFGSHCSATGGQGGRHASNTAQYSAVGVASGGDINIDGGYGGIHHENAGSNEGGGGHGGASFWGGGGGSANSGFGVSAQGGQAYGAGGGGGMHNSAVNGIDVHLGRDGHDGIVVVWEYVG